VTEETAIPSNVGLNQTKEEMTHRANVWLGHLRKEIIPLSSVGLGLTKRDITHQSVSGSAHHSRKWC
jgi:hypothetical protein